MKAPRVAGWSSFSTMRSLRIITHLFYDPFEPTVFYGPSNRCISIYDRVSSILNPYDSATIIHNENPRDDPRLEISRSTKQIAPPRTGILREQKRDAPRPRARAFARSTRERRNE